MTHDPSQKFGDIAARYAALRPDYPEDIFAFLLGRLDGPRAFAVDLGAGSGQATRALAHHFTSVAAVEADARMLAHLAGERIRKINQPAEEADFPPASADAVIAATSFHWMEQERVVANVARWLRPGGAFFPFLYTPFRPQGEAGEVYARHWRLWALHLDKRLGAKADYAAPIRTSGAFTRIETYQGKTSKRLAPAEAASLLATASYARAYMAASGEGESYLRRLEEELSVCGAEIEVVFPLGGVLAVKA